MYLSLFYRFTFIKKYLSCLLTLCLIFPKTLLLLQSFFWLWRSYVALHFQIFTWKYCFIHLLLIFFFPFLKHFSRLISWFKKAFVTSFWSPIFQQPWTTGNAWKICLKEERYGNKTVSQAVKNLFHSELKLPQNSLRCSFPHVFWQQWTFQSIKRSSENDFIKTRLSFVHQTVLTSKIWCTKNFDIWTWSYRTSR